MTFHVIENTTKGTCFAITGEKEALILEAGIEPEKVWKAVNFNLKNISGCLISNQANEVCKFARNFSEDMNVFSHAEIIRFLNIAHFNKVKAIAAGKTYQIDNFLVLPFLLQNTCFGYFINHAETGRIVYITHASNIPYKLNDINHVIIECNYMTEKLKENVKNESLRPILSRQIVNNRMSLETVLNWLKMQDLSKTKNILLCNVSEKNSDPETLKERVLLTTKINTEIAVKGLKIDLSI